MNESEVREDQTRGIRARELKENPVLIEALSAIEKEVIDQWSACPARDKDGKEALWQLYKMSQKFRLLLDGYIERGKLATHNLRAYEESKLDKVKSFLKRA